MKDIDKLAWISIRDKKVLVARSKDKEVFYMPGGKRDPGESDEEALIREVKEEVSVDLINDSIKYMETFSHQADGKPEGVMVKMTCYFADYHGDLKADAEIAELAWFDTADLPRTSAVSKYIFKYLKDKNLIN